MRQDSFVFPLFGRWRVGLRTVKTRGQGHVRYPMDADGKHGRMGIFLPIDAIRLACTDHDGSCESDICEGSIFIVCFISSFISFYL
jgi:hypothetical protein